MSRLALLGGTPIRSRPFPVAEAMHFETPLTTTDICHANITRADLDDFVAGIRKVIDYRQDLMEATQTP